MSNISATPPAALRDWTWPEPMQFLGQKPPAGIIFDCDLGNSIDGALAMALMYGLDGKNEARVVSVSISNPNLKAAALAEAIGRFYAGAVSGAFGGFSRSLPVGLNDSGKTAPDTPMLTAPLARQNPDGTPVYAHGIHKLNDTAEPTALIRNAFTAQQDQNCMVILAGRATNLVKVLDLPGAKELIERKVRYLAVNAGAFPGGDPEAHIAADVAAARKLFAEWPTPIIAAGREIGAAVLFPAASIEKDFAWSTAHPVVDAYRAYQAMPYDAPTGAMSIVLHAVRPKEAYFQLSEPGVISVLDGGRTKFSPSAAGRHRYLIFDPAKKEQVLKAYTEIASAKPVPRTPRFRRPDQDKKIDPPKPAIK